MEESNVYELIGGIVIVIFALLGFYKGAVMSTLYFLGTLFSIWIAHRLYQPFSKHLDLFIPFPKTVAYDTQYVIQFDDPSNQFTKLIGFILIIIVVKVLLRLLMSSMSRVLDTFQRPLLSRLFGVILGVGTGFIVLHFLFYIFALYPSDLLQSAMKASLGAQKIVLDMPFLSNITLNL
ncbi:CvpA family protein [Staphylococcus felis]|nr:CvpA family protein [Staphylococcus felis]REI04173.1 CvpA family protein [Staphylococcus felis]REI24797.1 CvpA family protein [Staphylococcus felis]REI30862.1 CvpA family protein [Staphylococcus felis]